VVGPEQRISVFDGLKAMTINGAYLHNEEKVKVGPCPPFCAPFFSGFGIPNAQPQCGNPNIAKPSARSCALTAHV
jgi:hypothetical protein